MEDLDSILALEITLYLVACDPVPLVVVTATIGGIRLGSSGLFVWNR